LPQQYQELQDLSQAISDYTFDLSEIIKNHNYNNTGPVMQKNEQLLTKIEMLRKTQVKRIKKEKDNTKRSLLYLAILFETKNMITDTLHVLKIEQRFIGNIDGDKLLANNSHY
jgi:Na+/phosphate symporter